MANLLSIVEKLDSQGDTFTVLLDGVDPMQFRRIKDAGEWYSTMRSAKDFYALCKKGQIPPELLAVSPTSEEVCQQAYLLHSTAIEPPLTLKDALTVAKKGGMVFIQLVNKLEIGGLEAISNNEEAKIDAAGEESTASAYSEHI